MRTRDLVAKATGDTPCLLSPIGVLFLPMPDQPVSVVEFPSYRRRADELLTADEQDAVVDLIAHDPTCGDVIQGTGGLRKMRIGLGTKGKRGGARVVYYFYNPDHPVLLLALYAKNEKADVSARDKRAFIALVKEIAASWQRK